MGGNPEGSRSVAAMIADAHRTEDQMSRSVRVGQVMSRDPLLLRADMRLEPAIELLIDHGHTGAPAVDERGKLIGMLHAIDVAIMHLLPANEHLHAPDRHVLVGEACRPAITIDPRSTMDVAAALMRDHDTDRLAVIDRSHHVAGVITGHDLLRTITRRGDLLQDIVDERVAELGLPYVTATVDRSGVVLLTGVVSSPQSLTALVDAIGVLDGVTEVDQLLNVAPRHSASRA
jgi:CBS domain-containing protein